MHGFWKLTLAESKLFLREPIGVFFTLVFPLLLLFIFGNLFGNQPIPGMDGYHMVDMMVPGYMAMIMGTTALISLPIDVAGARENGVLRRFQVTPLKPLVVLCAKLLVNLSATAVGILLVGAAGRWFLGLKMPTHPWSLLLACLYGTASLVAMGFVLAAILPSARTTQAVGMAVFFPMLFLSGGPFPVQAMPTTMQHISQALPLSHVVKLLQDVWFGTGAGTSSMVILAATFVLGISISSRMFRWS